MVRAEPPVAVATISDVATLAGVSISTVSRVLNDRADVSAATRARVTSAIEELGYEPRATARGLVSRTSRAISLLFPGSYAGVSNHDLEFVVGAAEAADERGYSFGLSTAALDARGLLRMFRAGLVDGVILMQISMRDWRVDLLAQHDLAGVLIGRSAEPVPRSWVDFDFETAVRSMYDHLVALGHRHIGFLQRPQRAVDAGLGAAVRLQAGFEAAIGRHALTGHSAPAEIERRAAGQAALSLLQREPSITALVATHNDVAVGTLRALAEAGVSVPGDVSVVGVTTTRLADVVSPGLTGVTFPSAEMGAQAVSLLIRQLEERATGIEPGVERILLPALLTVRDSTAAVRA